MSVIYQQGEKETPIIGEQSGLKEVSKKIEIIAPTNIPVLLLGETGSGKEVVARAIHESSPRLGKPFVRVNCGAISPALIDSELFGHERGSFTGADFAKKGWFERAHHGTLFLDEIGEMTESAQVRLLRILQDGTIDRVGAQRSIQVDVRIVAATHRDLFSMIEEKKFRHDLWYRISTFPISIPSLRERVQDIPLLTEFFVKRASQRFGVMVPPITSLDLEILSHYDWPGNVRELISVLERAVLLGKGLRLETAASLGMFNLVQGSSFTTMPPRVGKLKVLGNTGTSPGNLLNFDDKAREYIQAALRQSQGRISGPFGAAKLLGLNPSTLRSKLKRLGIDAFSFKNVKAG